MGLGCVTDLFRIRVKDPKESGTYLAMLLTVEREHMLMRRSEVL